MNSDPERKVLRIRGAAVEVVPISALENGDIWCSLCQAYIWRRDLIRWTGDDALHYLCPGCGSDLLPVQNLE